MHTFLWSLACTGTQVLAPDCSGEDTYAGAPDPEWMYQAEELHELRLVMPEEAMEALRGPYATPEEVDAIRAVTTCGTLETPWGVLADVDVALKGQLHSSFQPIDGKPYFKLGFGERTIEGTREIRLYNMWEDAAQIQAHLGYRMWRDVDQPAPRSGFAHVWLNDTDLGLYGITESIDEGFLSRWFTVSTGNLYEGEYGSDLTVDDVDVLELEQGTDDRTKLRALAEVVDGRVDYVSSLPPHMPLEPWFRFWALEIAVGAREGYTDVQNNWFLYDDSADPAVASFHMLPWGFDQALYDRLDPGNPRGHVPLYGTSQVDYRTLECDAILEVATTVDWSGLAEAIDPLVELLRDTYEAEDPSRRRFENVEIEARQASVRSYLEVRQADLLGWYEENC